MTTSGSTSLLEDLQQLFPYDDWLATLDAMAMHDGKRMKGLLAGKRRSSSLGSSLEFADYRPYIEGDDIRRIDWNLYGRTSKAYIRQYWDEQERSFHLYVDGTQSMSRIGSDLDNKWRFALRVAASVGYLVLQGEDRLTIQHFNETTVLRQTPMLHGKHAVFTMMKQLAGWMREAQEASAAPSVEVSDLSIPFAKGLHMPRRAGVTWIFSDALYERGVETLLSSLQARQQQVVFVHILHGEELDPKLEGEWRLVDIETSLTKEVAMSPAILNDYKKGVYAFRERLRQLCEQRGIAYYAMNSSEQLPASFLKLLAAGEHIQFR